MWVRHEHSIMPHSGNISYRLGRPERSRIYLLLFVGFGGGLECQHEEPGQRRRAGRMFGLRLAHDVISPFLFCVQKTVHNFLQSLNRTQLYFIENHRLVNMFPLIFTAFCKKVCVFTIVFLYTILDLSIPNVV